MNQYRHFVLEWLAQGHIKQGEEQKALVLAGVTPNPSQWKHFLDQLMLWMGALFCGAALIFFFAYNWDAMGKYAQFAIAEVAIITSILFYFKLEKHSMASKACLLFASLCVGALLALVGQTYQTGADTYELFTAWAIAIVAWVFIARLAALWLFWILLINVAVSLYFKTFDGVFGVIFSDITQNWILFIINTMALVIWEGIAYLSTIRGKSFNRPIWAIRILLFSSGSILTSIIVHYIFENYGYRNGSVLLPMFAYLLYMGSGYWYYRQRQKDIFALTGGVLSAIIISTSITAKYIIDFRDAGGFLVIGLLIIAQSGFGAWWLKKVTQEVNHE
jgi:uncharacterized membrane protein